MDNSDGRPDEHLIREFVAQAAREAGLGALAPVFTAHVLGRTGAAGGAAEHVDAAAACAEELAAHAAGGVARIFEGAGGDGAGEAQLRLVRAAGLALAAWHELTAAAAALER